VIGVRASVPWARISQESVDSHGLGTYMVVVDRTRIVAAENAGTISIVTNTSVVDLPFTVRVPDFNIIADAGRQYVLLRDPATGSVIEEVALTASRGWYAYQFDDVTKGSYQVVAGSDADNDGMICDLGEACGFYGSSTGVETITVDRNRSDIGFYVGFNDAVGETGESARGFVRLAH